MNRPFVLVIIASLFVGFVLMMGLQVNLRPTSVRLIGNWTTTTTSTLTDGSASDLPSPTQESNATSDCADNQTCRAQQRPAEEEQKEQVPSELVSSAAPEPARAARLPPALCRGRAQGGKLPDEMFEAARNVVYNSGSTWNVDDAQTRNLSPEKCLEACRDSAGCGAAVMTSTPVSGEAGRNATTCTLKRGPKVLSRVVAPSDPSTTSFLYVPRSVQFVASSNFSRAIAFGMISAPKFLDSRARAALSTWLCNHSVVVLLEDLRGAVSSFHRMIDTLPHECRAEKIAKVMRTPDLSKNGAWKDLPLTYYLVELFPMREWYMIVDDDTYVLPNNLNIELTTFYDPSVAIVIAMVCPQPQCAMREIRPVQKRRQNKIVTEYRSIIVSSPWNASLLAPQGGAGFVMSYAAIVQVSKNIPRCSATCKMNGGDIRIGCCLRMLSIPLVSSENLWSRTPFLAIGKDDNRPQLSSFPVSFHMMRRAKWVKQLHAWADHVDRNLPELCKIETEMVLYLNTSSGKANSSSKYNASSLRGIIGDGTVHGGSMCKVLARQLEHCDMNSTTAAGGGGGLRVSVPISWHALKSFLLRDGAFHWELFVTEPGWAKSLG